MELEEKCFCEGCLIGEERWWFSMGYYGGECVDGYLFLDLGDDCVSCSAFEVVGEPFARSVRLQFVSMHNLIKNNATARSSICIDFSHVFSAPEKVLNSMIEAGFYVCPDMTAVHLARAIRLAVDFAVSEMRSASEDAPQHSVAREAQSVTLQ